MVDNQNSIAYLYAHGVVVAEAFDLHTGYPGSKPAGALPTRPSTSQGVSLADYSPGGSSRINSLLFVLLALEKPRFRTWAARVSVQHALNARPPPPQ